MFEVPTSEELNLAGALPVIILAVGTSLLLVLDRFFPRRLATVYTALGIVATALIVALLQAGDVGDIGDPGTAFIGMYTVDQFTHVVNIVALLSAGIGILVAYDYLERTGLDRGEYYILVLFAALGAMLMGASNNLIMVFVSLELLSIPLYILSGIRRPQEESEESAMKYFLLGAFASAFMVYGIALVFGATGSLQLPEIYSIASEVDSSDATNQLLLLMGSGLLLVGLGFKVAAVPFHMWTPDVYQGAPTPVTAYMSVVAKAGGFAALVRVFALGLPVVLDGDEAALWGLTVQILAVATLIVGNVIAIVQTDLKRLLAYSSIAHAGYILVGVAAASVPGVEDEAARATLVYLAAYTFTNIGAFAIVTAVEQNDTSGTAIRDIKGLGTTHPRLAAAMVVFMLSLTGIPLTGGFIGKFYVFSAALEADMVVLAVIAVLTSVVSAFYYVRIIWNMYFEAPDGAVNADTRSPLLATALWITALGTVVLGVLPGVLEQLVSDTTLALLR